MLLRNRYAVSELPGLASTTIAGFHRDGFAVLERVTTRADLERIARLVSVLYERFGELKRHRRACDLGPGADRPQILEINQILALAPALQETKTYARCQALAGALLGREAEYHFDHTIYKPPFNGAATAWHQDDAYVGWDKDDVYTQRHVDSDTRDPGPMTVTFWVPLHDVSIAMGCMHFVPGSHRQPMRRHRQRTPGAAALEAMDVDTSRAVACPLRAGDATVHWGRTLHYTGPNLTPTPRLAWSLMFAARRRLGVRLVGKARRVWQGARPG